MRILAMEREIEGITQVQMEPHLVAEAARVWELYQAGFLRELYFRQDVHNAVLFLECASTEEVGEVLNTLPLVKEGLIAFDLVPLVPYSGFARLFGGEK